MDFIPLPPVSINDPFGTRDLFGSEAPFLCSLEIQYAQSNGPLILVPLLVHLAPGMLLGLGVGAQVMSGCDLEMGCGLALWMKALL